MENLKKPLLISVGILALIACGFGIYNYILTHSEIEKINICQDDDLISKLIVQNANPFTKFKFIKKRNTDCKVLLINNKEEAIQKQNAELCSSIDASTNSVTMLIHTYVNDMYDRENASKEFNNMVPLMTPYNYCPQYMTNMITLIKLKKRLGL